MRPLRLTMQAFGSYGTAATVDFEKTTQNLFLITGDTGAGKTTIFDAIVFALYGQASSSHNKKDGLELQSQYADLKVEPYVELTFTELVGGEQEEYTVKRIPRHMRPAKHKGAKDQTVSETVELTMPDGSSYPQKETDQKLEEIVGLTRDQFMQVAMIAQGEFMELLRADSNSKKKIFQRLFGTGLFQGIVDELARRRAERESKITELWIKCRQEIGHVEIPEAEELREFTGPSDSAGKKAGSFETVESTGHMDDGAETEETVREAAESVSSGPYKGETADLLMELSLLQRKLLAADKFNRPDMEAFLERLESLCALLESAGKTAKTQETAFGLERDRRRDAVTEAHQLLQSYQQLEKAQQQLSACAEKEEEIERDMRMIPRIRDGWEVQAVHQRFRDAEKIARNTEDLIKKLREDLPGLQKKAASLGKAEEEAKKRADTELAAYTRISERVKKALSVLSGIRSAEENVRKCAAAASAAKEKTEKADKEQEAFAKQENQWQQTARDLAGADADLVIWQSRQQDADSIRQMLANAVDSQAGLTRQLRKVEQAQKEFINARDAHSRKADEYRDKNDAFLSAQAGVLAAQLVPGQPCPVCGSREHPHPCTGTAEHEELSRDQINALREEAEELNRIQTGKAAAAHSAAEVQEEKQRSLTADILKISEKMKSFSAALKDMEVSMDDMEEAMFGAEASIPAEDGQTEILSPSQSEDRIHTLKGILENWQTKLQEEIRVRQKKAAALADVQKKLVGAQEKREELQAAHHDAVRKSSEADQALTAARTSLEGLQAQRDYEDEKAARDSLKYAEAQKKEVDRIYTAAHKAADTARSSAEEAATLLRQYEEALPGQEQESAARRSAYEALCREKGFEEIQWLEMIQAHKKEEADMLQARVDAWQKQKAEAEGSQKTAQDVIQGRPRPDLKALSEAQAAAQAALDAAQNRKKLLEQHLKADRKAWTELSPKMEERSRAAAEYDRINELFERLGGKRTGARMDIETFVQRYYLQRILRAANVRFSEMSAGQFELRMVGDDMAGAGKNRGLDLMVYSAVTGKEREIRTLSGGESFMAALSLALGMADQIQEGSASINLDIMFIDEGFGSLDDHARDQAVRVLKRMAGGSKLVAIISHVTELKQEIDDQLLVTRDENGSHARWQAGSL